MPSFPSQFVFATCAPASTAGVKRDVARDHPTLRLAFSRPGVITWKISADTANPLPLATPWACVSGFSLGRAHSPASLAALLEPLALDRAHLHVFELWPRDTARAEKPAYGERAARVEAEIRGALAEQWASGPPAVGQWIVDVILRPASEPDEPWVVGIHAQRRDRPTTAGCVQPAVVPAAAPSRAYAKIVEMLAFGEVGLRAGSHAVEIGAAPGGAALALLERGLYVTAIDTAPMAASVLAYVGPAGNRLRHLAVAAGAVRPSDLPREIDLLSLDANLAPPVALRYLERLCARLSSPPRAMALTLKLNDERVRESTTEFVQRCRVLGRSLGLMELRAAQLPSHRQEIGVVLRPFSR